MVLCKVCRHSARRRLERALANGASRRGLAARYGLTEATLRRHARNHMGETLTRAIARVDEARGDSLLDRLRQLTDHAMRICSKAESLRQYGPAISALKEVARHVELVARLTGRIGEGASTTVNVAIVQQQEREQKELRDLSRLSVDELRTLQRLEAKMRSVETIEVEALPAPEKA